MTGRLTAIDIPVAVGNGMRRSPRRDPREQQIESIVWFDMRKIGAVLAQIAKERRVIGGDPLADDGDPEAAGGHSFGRRGGAQPISVYGCGFAKTIELVGAP